MKILGLGTVLLGTVSWAAPTPEEHYLLDVIPEDLRGIYDYLMENTVGQQFSYEFTDVISIKLSIPGLYDKGWVVADDMNAMVPPITRIFDSLLVPNYRPGSFYTRHIHAYKRVMHFEVLRKIMQTLYERLYAMERSIVYMLTYDDLDYEKALTAWLTQTKQGFDESDLQISCDLQSLWIDLMLLIGPNGCIPRILIAFNKYCDHMNISEPGCLEAVFRIDHSAFDDITDELIKTESVPVLTTGHARDLNAGDGNTTSGVENADEENPEATSANGKGKGCNCKGEKPQDAFIPLKTGLSVLSSVLLI